MNADSCGGKRRTKKMNREEQFAALTKLARTMDTVHITSRTVGSITLQHKDDGGIGMVCRYALFPGIFLSFNDMGRGSFPCFKGRLYGHLRLISVLMAAVR
jgi:hypothetical protein